MKKLFIIMLALVVAMSSCGKKKAEEAAAAKKAEEARQEAIFEDNLASLGSNHLEWINWYIMQRGFRPGELLLCHLPKGMVIGYTFQDTIRKDTLPKSLVVPKLPPRNAFVPNAEKSTINSWNTPVMDTLLFEDFPNPVPVQLLLRIGTNKNGRYNPSFNYLLTGGSIKAPDMVAKGIDYWFTFDIPGTLQELDDFSDPGDSFLIAQRNLPGVLHVFMSKHKKVDGKIIWEHSTYFIKEDGSVVNY